MTAIAGSKGRIEEIGEAGVPSRAVLAKALLTREASIQDALAFFCENARLREVSVEINMVCNLHCSYCYLAQRNTKDTVPMHVWRTRLREAALDGARLIAIVGKEPFIDERGANLLAFLDGVRRENGLRFRCGAVTNGTLLDRHVASLAAIGCIDYLDISLDGIGRRHDEIRGRGSFDRAVRGFQAARELKNLDSLFINNTIHQQNVAALREFVLGTVALGVENLHFSPVVNFTADPSVDGFLLSPDQVRRILDELVDLSVHVPGQTMFELPIEYVWRFLADGIISAEDMREDANGVLFVRPDRHRRFFLKTAVFPGHFWSNARVSHEGLYLAELDTVAWARPEYAIGNIRHESIPELFAAARRKGGWFGRYFRFTLDRLLHTALRGGLGAADFPLPDAWRLGAPVGSGVPVLQEA